MGNSVEKILVGVIWIHLHKTQSSQLHPNSHTHACTLFTMRSKIRETLNNLVLRSPQEWQTSIGLPFVKIEGTVC